MKRIALTGGIASGKSTVAGLLTDCGVPVVDADRLARQVVAPGSEGLAAVVAAFGPDVLDAGGGLDRAKMGRMVFSDSQNRKKLESILHPRIAAAGVAAMRELEEAGHPLSVYEAALIFENGLEDAFDATLLVTASKEHQMHRLQARDGLTESEALQRIEAQMPLREKEQKAAYVLRNEGSLQQLEQDLKAIWNELTAPGLA